MSTHPTRPATALQAATPADCRHSRQAFDASFRVIAERRDISPAAKLVHAHLVTLHRTGRAATQAEIGEALGLSRHQVWRAAGELVAAGLVRVTRRGQGLPNGYELVGVPAEDLDGRASRSRPPGQSVAGQSGPPAYARHSGPNKTTKNWNENRNRSARIDPPIIVDRPRWEPAPEPCPLASGRIGWQHRHPKRECPVYRGID